MDTIETEPTDLRNPKLVELRQKTEDYVRAEPTKAVGIALVTGILLTAFPIFRLLGGILRLALTVFKPVLYVLGAAKLYEEFKKR